MRWTERAFGVLAGVLGLAALLVTATHQVIIEHAGSAILSIPSIPVATDDRLAIAIPAGSAALGSLLVALGAVQDTRRGTARGRCRALVVVSAALCVLGVYLLGANNVRISINGSLPTSSGVVAGPSVASVSAGFLFAPAALMGIVAAALAGIRAVLPRGHAPALG